MNQYMVVIDLPQRFDNDFIALIPRQRAMINKLLRSDTISSYTLSKDRGTLWVTLVADTEEEVRDVIDSFPVRRFFDYTISELMFHEHAAMLFPHFSLN